MLGVAPKDLQNLVQFKVLRRSRRDSIYWFDPGLKRAYAACSSGVIMVVQEDDADDFRKLEDFRVQPQVHSLAVDAETHRVYAPEQEEDGKPVARMIVYDAVSGRGLH